MLSLNVGNSVFFEAALLLRRGKQRYKVILVGLHVCTVHQQYQGNFLLFQPNAHNYKIIEILKQLNSRNVNCFNIPMILYLCVLVWNNKKVSYSCWVSEWVQSFRIT
jgi:hypothetical protein